MRNEVWLEQENISQQFGKVVKHESADLENTTVTVIITSQIGEARTLCRANMAEQQMS